MIYKLEVSCDTVTGQTSIPIGSKSNGNPPCGPGYEPGENGECVPISDEGNGESSCPSGYGPDEMGECVPCCGSDMIHGGGVSNPTYDYDVGEGGTSTSTCVQCTNKCDPQSIVGSWDWHNHYSDGDGKVIVFPNGALEIYLLADVSKSKLFDTGKWTLYDSSAMIYNFDWDNHPDERVTLRGPDCKFFEGTNDWDQSVDAMRTEVPSPILTGTWEMTARPGLPCRIMQKGDALTFVNEKGDQSSGRFLGPSNVIADDWGHLRGTVSADENSIVWDDGSTWVKKSDYLGY